MPNHFKVECDKYQMVTDSIEVARSAVIKLIRRETYATNKIVSRDILNGLTLYGTVRVSYNKEKKEYQYWWFPVTENKKIHYYRINEDGTLRYAIERKKGR